MKTRYGAHVKGCLPSSEPTCGLQLPDAKKCPPVRIYHAQPITRLKALHPLTCKSQASGRLTIQNTCSYTEGIYRCYAARATVVFSASARSYSRIASAICKPTASATGGGNAFPTCRYACVLLPTKCHSSGKP